MDRLRVAAVRQLPEDGPGRDQHQPESILENRAALVGSPEEVIDQVAMVREAFGEVEPSLQMNFGGMSEREAFRTLELFATRVMPKFTS